MRITDSDNALLVQKARRLRTDMLSSAAELGHLLEVIDAVYARMAQSKKAGGTRPYRAEFYALRDHIYIARLHYQDCEDRYNGAVANLSRRLGLTEYEVRLIVGGEK